MAYAEKTTVSVASSKAQIEELLIKHGADEYATGHNSRFSFLGFSMGGRRVKLVIPALDPESEEVTHTSQGKRRGAANQKSYYAQATKQKWRALLLIVKAKLEAVESGITTFEEEFMPHIILPDGATVGEHLLPKIKQAYATGKMPALLPAFEGE